MSTEDLVWMASMLIMTGVALAGLAWGRTRRRPARIRR
jgi:hypothetical protein